MFLGMQLEVLSGAFENKQNALWGFENREFPVLQSQMNSYAIIW